MIVEEVYYLIHTPAPLTRERIFDVHLENIFFKQLPLVGIPT
jgi:hypothetical protein